MWPPPLESFGAMVVYAISKLQGKKVYGKEMPAIFQMKINTYSVWFQFLQVFGVVLVIYGRIW